MGAFEDVLLKAKAVAESAGKKTSELVEVTKLRMEAAEVEKDMAATLEGLGRLVYDSRKAGEDVSDLISECVIKVDEQQARLAELQEKIWDYQNVVRCKRCNTVNADDAVFCKKCGSKIRDEE